jgi:hypothetical protein
MPWMIGHHFSNFFSPFSSYNSSPYFFIHFWTETWLNPKIHPIQWKSNPFFIWLKLLNLGQFIEKYKNVYKYIWISIPSIFNWLFIEYIWSSFQISWLLKIFIKMYLLLFAIRGGWQGVNYVIQENAQEWR